MKKLCPNLIDGIACPPCPPHPSSAVLSHYASCNQWNLDQMNSGTSALKVCGSGSQGDRGVHEVPLLLPIYHSECNLQQTVLMDLINLLDFYILSYALKLNVLNCTNFCNLVSLLDFILFIQPIMLVCQAHSES